MLNSVEILYAYLKLMNYYALRNSMLEMLCVVVRILLGLLILASTDP
jgi:hypothetical protein